jgi:flagellar M-ring protein FliF
MARLVSNAAPGLLAANVIISDTQGNLLSRGGEEALGSGSFNQTRARESWLQEKAQTALDAALGAGRAVVRVDANIELDRIETRKEEVKPESKVVTKERISSSTSSTGKKASGSPSTSATITGASTGSGGGNATEDLESEYAYDRTITRKVVEAGAIRRLTIGVLLDANAEPKISSDTVREIVKGAVGFDDQRRDFIEVTAVPFAAKPEATPATESLAPAAPDWSHVVDIVKWSVTAVVALGVLFFALKALKAAKATLAVATAEAAPKEERRPADPREEITRELDRDAQAVGRLLRNWLYEASRN